MNHYQHLNGKADLKEGWSLNWGDRVGPGIVRHFSGSEKIYPTQNIDGPKLVTVGSVMGAVRRGDLVWGTGILRAEMNYPLMGRADIYAVRGRLTSERLEALGIKASTVWGDPALLYPEIYNPEVEVTHRWGIIPHYVDEENPIIDQLERDGVKRINICAGEERFIDQVLSVERVVSSSLHGLVAADAYGIPNARIKLSDGVIGGDFKFADYATGTGRKLWSAVQVGEGFNIERLEKLQLNDINNFDRDRLLEAAPWNFEKNKHLFY